MRTQRPGSEPCHLSQLLRGFIAVEVLGNFGLCGWQAQNSTLCLLWLVHIRRSGCSEDFVLCSDTATAVQPLLKSLHQRLDWEKKSFSSSCYQIFSFKKRKSSFLLYFSKHINYLKCFFLLMSSLSAVAMMQCLK